jgi:hypothetical protein
MSVTLIFLTLCSGSIFCTSFFKKRFEEALPITSMSIIIILFLFGLIDALKIGFYVTWIACLLAIISAVIFVTINRTWLSFVKSYFTPSFFLFTVIILVIYFLNQGRLLTSWDEFSHWGTVAKAMFLTDKISTITDRQLLFRSYPPAIALFQYFIMSIKGEWVEYVLFFSYSILSLSLFFPFFKNIQWNNCKKLFGALFVMFIPTIIFYNYFFTTILIDPIFAIFFGYCLAEAFFFESKDSFSLFRLCLGLFILPIIKDTGIFFSLIVIFVFLTNQYISLKKTKHELNNPLFSYSKVRDLYTFIKYLSIIIIPAYSKMAWNANIKFHNTPQNFTINFKEVISVILSGITGYRRNVVSSFMQALTTVPITNYQIQLSFWSWLSIVVSILALLYLSSFEIIEKKKLKTVCIIISLGCGIYALGLLIIYLTVFSEYEVVRLASYPRYMSTYFQGIVVLISLIILKISIVKRSKNNSTKYIILISLVFLMIITPVSEINPYILRDGVRSSIEMRSPYSQAVSEIDAKNIPPNSKIWIICQNSNGNEYWILRYELLEYYVNESLWSIGEPYSSEDIWTYKLSPDDWREELYNYDFVFIYKLDDKFIDNFKDVFEAGSELKGNTLYSVIKKDHKISLKTS